MIAEKYKVFDNMIEGVQVIDAEFRYVYVNKMVAQHGKTTQAELLGQKMTDKYPGIEESKMFFLLKKCLKEHVSHQMINEFDFPDGSKGYFELRMDPIEEGVLIMSFDVTDQKRAEQLIKDNNKELERLVEERTQELKKQNLLIEQQVQKLEELNHTKDIFFSIVAHDLKSPLNSLKGYSELLIHQIDSLTKGEISEMSSQLSESLDNTIKMADNLIAWASLQMKDITVNSESIPMEELINTTFSIYKPIAQKKRIKLNLSIAKDMKVFGDRNQLEFVIRNLVNNAIKYTNIGGEVEIMADNLNAKEVQIAIKDNGVGISKELIAKIFNLNKRKSNLGTSGEKGTGLGLMLSHEFLLRNQGSIDIESKEGVGSLFRLKLKRGK